jgi:hypothetical protein
MKPTTQLTAIVLFALVTVEFGGWSLLGLLTGQGSLTPFQEQFFRAGHGHAGVLLTLALVYLILIERTGFSPTTQRLLGLVLLGGIVLQSGGFFLHMTLGEESRSSAGTLVTRLGAVLLATALVSLGVGLLQAGKGKKPLLESRSS